MSAERLLIAGDALSFYLTKLVWPTDLGPDYGRSPARMLESSALRWSWFGPTLVLLAAGLLPGRRLWLLSLGVFVAALLPVLGLVPFEYQNFSTVADRYVYVALLGPSLALAGALEHRSKRMTLGVAILLVVIFGPWSFLQSQVWRNDRALYGWGAKVNPASTVCQNGLGNALAARGELDEAAACYRAAIQHRPDRSQAYFNLANVHQLQGSFDEAISSLRDAIRVQPDYAKAYRRLGTLLVQKGEYEEASANYERALELRPGDPEVLNDLGNLELQLGKSQRAAGLYRQALDIAPTFGPTRDNLLSLLRHEERWNEAFALLDELEDRGAILADIEYERGVTASLSGDSAQAAGSFEEALRHDPGHVGA